MPTPKTPGHQEANGRAWGPELTLRQKRVLKALRSLQLRTGSQRTYPDRYLGALHALSTLGVNYDAPNQAANSLRHIFFGPEKKELDRFRDETRSIFGGRSTRLLEDTLERRLGTLYKGLCDFAHYKETDPAKFSGLVREFEDLTLAFHERFFTSLDRVRELRQASPVTDQTRAELRLKLANPYVYEYFFHSCDNPEWLPVLARMKVLTPQEQDASEAASGRSVHRADWIEGEFLKKIVGKRPGEVLGIIESVKPTSLPVAADLFEILSGLPAEHMAGTPVLVRTWLEENVNGFDYVLEKAADVLKRVAEHSLRDTAFEIADVVFDVFQGTRKIDEFERKHLRSDHKTKEPIPLAYGSSIIYGELLQKMAPLLAKLSPWETWLLLARKLEEYARIRSESFTSKEVNDGSRLWRHTVRPSEEDKYSDRLAGSLVDQIVKMAEDAHANDKPLFEKMMGYLSEGEYSIFHRIYIHLASVSLDSDSRHLAPVLENFRTWYGGVLVWPEILQLVKMGFPKNPDIRKVFYDLMRAGHEVPGHARDPEAFTREWYYRRLAPVREHLDDEWKGRLEVYEKELRAIYPDMAEQPDTQVQERPAPDFSKMSAEEAIDYVDGWEHPDELSTPTPLGVASMISKQVELRPCEFADRLDTFGRAKGRHAGTFAEWLIRGFRNVVGKEEGPMDGAHWRHVLGLCLRLVKDQLLKGQLSGDSDTRGEEDNWGSCMQAVADLLDALLTKENQPERNLGEGLRETIETLLERLSGFEPAPDWPALSDETDWLTVAINRTDGRTMEALIKYGMWRARVAGLNVGQGSAYAFMPRVRDLIERAVNSRSHPAVHAILGMYIVLLYHWDKKWTERNLQLLFPEDERGKAAWATYLKWTTLHPNGTDLLYDKFLHSAEALVPEDEQNPGYAADLGRHVIVHRLYRRDDVEIAKLFQTYVRRVDVASLKEAIWQIRTSRMLGPLPPSPDQSPRSEEKAWYQMWMDVLNARQQVPGGLLPVMNAVLAVPHHYLQHLEKAALLKETLTRADVGVADAPDGLNDVIDVLNEAQPHAPLVCAECVRLYLEKVDLRFSMRPHLAGRLKVLLGSLLAVDQQEVHEAAEGCVHKMGELGSYEFEELLGAD